MANRDKKQKDKLESSGEIEHYPYIVQFFKQNALPTFRKILPDRSERRPNNQKPRRKNDKQ